MQYRENHRHRLSEYFDAEPDEVVSAKSALLESDGRPRRWGDGSLPWVAPALIGAAVFALGFALVRSKGLRVATARTVAVMARQFLFPR